MTRGAVPGPGNPGRTPSPLKHENVIFIISYKSPGFTGFFSGVDFYSGRGSTSSISDAARLFELGCKIEDPEQRTVIEKHIAETKARLEKAKAKQKAWDEFLATWPTNPEARRIRENEKSKADERAQEAKRAAGTSQRARWKRVHASQY